MNFKETLRNTESLIGMIFFSSIMLYSLLFSIDWFANKEMNFIKLGVYFTILLSMFVTWQYSKKVNKEYSIKNQEIYDQLQKGKEE